MILNHAGPRGAGPVSAGVRPVAGKDSDVTAQNAILSNLPKS